MVQREAQKREGDAALKRKNDMKIQKELEREAKSIQKNAKRITRKQEQESRKAAKQKVFSEILAKNGPDLRQTNSRNLKNIAGNQVIPRRLRWQR
eukprot:IDg15449t1